MKKNKKLEINESIEELKEKSEIIRIVKPTQINNRINLKILVGEHIVLFLHRENEVSYIIAKMRIHSLQECVTIKERQISFVIDTRKPTFIWGNMRLYLIDCETSQQVSLNPYEKIIDINVVQDFVYRESLYKLTKNVHKGNLQNLSILIGFIMGSGIMGLILMLLMSGGVL